jgi:hypothetical protein
MSTNFYPPNYTYNYLTYRENYSLNDRKDSKNNNLDTPPKNRLYECFKFFIDILLIVNICLIVGCSIISYTKFSDKDSSIFNIICLILSLTRLYSRYVIDNLYVENSYTALQFIFFMFGEFMLMSLGIYFVRNSQFPYLYNISFKTPLDITKLYIWSQLIYGLTYSILIISSYCYFKHYAKKREHNLILYTNP